MTVSDPACWEIVKDLAPLALVRVVGGLDGVHEEFRSMLGDLTVDARGPRRTPTLMEIHHILGEHAS